ncbi:hypothetical protein AURDEDRAFT_178006 [Auricularia subglabra TFB-10046 SS5]|uniref:DUF7330 domain-containing protein n=1 Tax=Auricularia subglabra (strain TFB-10046 / SS5) TaxID=717982 RepID=J0WM77_AURST|nr:hypothetical protein AURDEDRAFT_178006 [Auricularia subglabra TFB-10046 SS5]
MLGRVNMLSVSKSGSILGSYILDPMLATSPPPKSQADRSQPNLRLASTESFVDADVWVLGFQGGSGSTASSTTLMDFAAQDMVTVRLHSLGSGPCTINAHSAHGDVVFIIPRDFIGLVRTSSASDRTPVIPKRFSTLSEVHGEGVYFVGDWTSFGPDGWVGPTLHIKAPQGNITVKFWKAPDTNHVDINGSAFGLFLLLLMLPRPPAWIRWGLGTLCALEKGFEPTAADTAP